MKKTNKSAVIVFVLLLLVAVTAMMVASTYAKYTAEVTGTGSVTVAKWAFASENQNPNFTVNIDLPATVHTSTLVDGKIAPGTSGSFDIELSNLQSEVGVDFTIAFTGTSNVPKNLVFKQGTTVIDPTNGTITGHIARGEESKVPLTWEWAYYTNATDDGEDTTDGVAANEMTITAVITGVQTQPSATELTTTFPKN